jgi:hypothetical protein
MAGLWIDLRSTLARLDAAAADPDLLLADVGALPALQYELHRALELAAGVVPPEHAADVHDELVAALGEAREATADVAAALAHEGPAAATPLVWEWRGALFRVRFARVRLERPRPVPAEVADVAVPPRTHPAAAASALVTGSALVLLAAMLGLWLLMALTLTGTVVGAFALRP